MRNVALKEALRGCGVPRILVCVCTVVLASSLFFCPLTAVGKGTATKQETWPTTMDAAVEDLMATLPDEDKETLRHMKREELIQLHMGFGRSIRNHYGLWCGNESLIRSACGGKRCHPDSASMRIIEKVWEKLQ